jgi:hypothetical protein
MPDLAGVNAFAIHQKSQNMLTTKIIPGTFRAPLSTIFNYRRAVLSLFTMSARATTPEPPYIRLWDGDAPDVQNLGLPIVC